jgi:tetratricopeptide (TPR) repeat protein
VVGSLLLALVGCAPAKRMIAERYYRQGMELFEKKKYDEAALAFRKAIQKNPNWGEPYYRLALSDLARGGEMSRAIHALRQASALMPENEDIKVRLAGLYAIGFVNQGGLEETFLKQARDLVNSLLRRNPNSFEGQLLAGQIALLGNQPQDAVGWFEKALHQKPESAFLLAAAGKAYFVAGQADKAEQLLTKAVQLDPGLRQAWEDRYQLYLFQNRARDAELLCQDRVARNPKDPLARLMLASHYLRSGRRQEMEAALEPLASNPEQYPAGALLAGDFHRNTGRIDKARALYESGLKHAEKNRASQLEYRKRLAWLLVLEGRREEAEQAYAKLLQEAPADQESRVRRAQLQIGRDAAATLTEYRQLAKDFPADPIIRHHLGVVLLANGQEEEARQAFLAASQMQRNYLAPRLALARLALERKQWKELQQHASSAVALNSRNPESRYLLAVAHLELGLYRQARRELEDLSREVPNLIEALLQMARLDLVEGRYAASDSKFRDLFRKTRDPRALAGRVEVALAQGENETAVRLVQAELASSPQDARLRLLLAQTALRAGQYEIAIRELDALTAQYPGREDLHAMIGQAHEASGRYPQAISAYEAALKSRPGQWEILERLANAYWKGGRTKDAINAYRKVLELNANAAVAMNNLAFLLSEDNDGDLDEALRLAKLAMQKLPNQPEVLDTAGWIYYRKNDLTTALQIYQGLVNKHPHNPGFRLHHAAVLLKQGKKDQARAELEAALASAPPAQMKKQIDDLMSRL